MAQSMLAELDAPDYPYLSELIREQALRPGWRHGDHFDSSLNILLEAIGRERERKLAANGSPGMHAT